MNIDVEFSKLAISKPRTAFEIALHSVINNDADAIEKMRILYAQNLIDHHNYYEARPPFSKKMSLFFKFMLNNVEKFESITTNYVEKHFSANFKTEYGLPTDYTIADIPIDSNEQTVPFTYSDEFRDDLIYNVKKYQLTRSIIKNYNGMSITENFYVGEKDGQILLFKDRLEKYRNGKTNSYTMSVIVNGRKSGFMQLFRLDYNPIRIHVNKLENGKVNECITNPESDWQNIVCSTPVTTHLHKSSTLYSVMFPNYLNSTDSTPIDFPIDKFDCALYHLKKKANIDTKQYIIINNMSTKLKVCDMLEKIKNIIYTNENYKAKKNYYANEIKESKCEQ